MGRMIAAVLAFSCLSLPVAPPAAGDFSGHGIRHHHARGVAWPWERTRRTAENAGREFWDFVDGTLRALAEDFHCNLVWVVNIGMDDAARLCDLAGLRGIKVLPNINPFLNLTYHGINCFGQVTAAAEAAFEQLGGKEALGAYLLRDEPRKWLAGQMEWFRRALAKADPGRNAIVVTMIHDTDAYIHQTGFPVHCVDIYPFGADRSPNIPNPAAASQRVYRGALEALSASSKRMDKRLWVIPQVSAEFWGPWWYDENMQVVIEPGTYHHWRMPTEAETRWQAWEAVRNGCRGIVYYVFLPAYNPWDGRGEVPETMARRWENLQARVTAGRWPVVAGRVRTGMAEALLHVDGSPTPQMEEMGRVFGVLEELEELLLALEPADFPLAFSEAVFSTAAFAGGPAPGRRHVVVVNNDLERAREERVHFLPHTVAVRDLVSGRAPALEADETGDTVSALLLLEPGGGTVLELSFAGDEPGVLLFDDDFSIATLGVTMKNAVRRSERRVAGTGWEWAARRETGLPPDAKGELAIGRISEPGGATGGVLVSERTGLASYIFVSGDFRGSESLVLEWSGAEERRGRLMSDNYHLPARIPPGVGELALKFADGLAVKRIIIFAVPRTGS